MFFVGGFLSKSKFNMYNLPSVQYGNVYILRVYTKSITYYTLLVTCSFSQLCIVKFQPQSFFSSWGEVRKNVEELDDWALS